MICTVIRHYSDVSGSGRNGEIHATWPSDIANLLRDVAVLGTSVAANSMGEIHRETVGVDAVKLMSNQVIRSLDDHCLTPKAVDRVSPICH